MIRLLQRQLIWSLSVLLGLCVLTFVLSYVAPGDPARIILGSNAQPDSVAALRAEMGLDRPLLVQFGSFMWEILTGHWGNSWISRQPVLSEIGDHLQPTLWLGFFASIYSITFALLLNAAAFIFPRIGRPLIATLRLGIALPGFVVAVAAALVTIKFQGRTGWTADTLSSTSFLLPAFAVALYPSCVMTTLLRARFSDILVSPYYRAARASGYPLRTLFSRVLLPNSWATLVTVWVNQISLLVFSTIIVEWVFSFRGIGTLLISSIQGKDLPVLSGIILLNGVFFLFVRFLSLGDKITPNRSVSTPALLNSTHIPE